MKIFIAAFLLTSSLFANGWDWVTPWTWNWNLFAKPDLISQVCTLTHNPKLPKPTEELLAQVAEKPTLEVAVQHYLAILQTTTPASSETAQKALGDIAQVTVNELEPKEANALNRLLSDLLEIKVGLRNSQFYTDSIMTLIFSEKNAPEGSKASRFYHSEKSTPPEVTEHAQAVAKQQGFGEHTRWMFGARTPGIGFLTHSGWTRTSVPNPEHSLWATRTLGLALGNRVAIGEVRLNFQALGPMSRDTAKIILEYVSQYAYNIDKHQLPPSTNMLHGLSADQKQTVQKITEEFVQDEREKVEQLYRQVTQ